MLSCLFVLFLVLSLSSLAPATAAEQIKLRMNSQFTATTAGSKIDRWFADEVAKATDGAVNIQIFWAGSLGAPKENLSLLSPLPGKA